MHFVKLILLSSISANKINKNELTGISVWAKKVKPRDCYRRERERELWDSLSQIMIVDIESSSKYL